VETFEVGESEEILAGGNSLFPLHLQKENILLATNGHIKLIDFGTAKDTLTPTAPGAKGESLSQNSIFL
jgi:serine/threonine protein kinase